VAWAAIPDAGVIHGCYVKKSGALRVIEAGKTCKATEATLDWNQQGLQGPPGTTNVAGVYSKVSHQVTPPDTVANPIAYCDAGDQVIAGGFYQQGGDFREDLRLLASYPQMPEDAWQVSAYNQQSQDIDIYAAVVCMDLAP
jgi:hypothetical protein